MTKSEVLAIFELAGIKLLNTWEIKNKYMSTREDPWWLVKTEKGMVEIGWRKRVISIDWSDCNTPCVITSDDVTQDDLSIHAYSVAKAVEYMTNLAYHWRNTSEQQCS